MKKALCTLAVALTALEYGYAMDLGQDFIQSSQSKNVWIYRGSLDTPGLERVERILEEKKVELSEIDGYVLLPEDKELTFQERIKLIGWAQEKEKETSGNISALHRFIWMSLAMLKGAVSSLSSGSIFDWIKTHQAFYFGRLKSVF